jgi:hypothetical protein
MFKTLTLRSTLTYGVLDLMFAPFVIMAFTQLIGTGTSSEPVMTLAGLTVLKVIVWAAYGAFALGPWERLARSADKHRTPELVQAADRALQAFPLRFAAVYTSTWIATYVVGYGIVKGLGPERMPLPPQTDNAIGVLCLAILCGAFAFAYPLASTLTADGASQCSALARSGGYGLDRAPSALQLRIAVIAVMLGLGPMLWMVALGYVKQLESSHAERITRGALASTELALSLSAVNETGQRAVFEELQRKGIDGLLLDETGLRGVDAASPSVRGGS